MKRFLFALLCLQCTLFAYAQTDKTVTLIESGTLSALVGNDVDHISKLTITGVELSQADFMFLKKMLIDHNLQEIDMERSLTGWIPESAFQKCTNLKAIKLPANLHTINRLTFGDCTGLVDVKFPFSSYIDVGAFWRCSSLKSITFPRGLLKICAQAFIYCDNLTEIHCSNTIPVDCNYSSFEYLHEKVTLYVPEGSLQTYSLAEGWIYFKNIVEEKVDAPYSVRVNYNEGGSVFNQNMEWGQNYILVDKNSSIALGINCDTDKMVNIESVTFNGVDVSFELIAEYKMNKYFITPPITRDSEFNVVFKLGINSSITEIESSRIKISTQPGIIQIENTEPNEVIYLYTTTGMLLQQVKSTGETVQIAVPQKQIYLVKASDKTVKVSM